MISSFTNKVLIEQAELDRLQQRQLREHLPKLKAKLDWSPTCAFPKQYEGHHGGQETYRRGAVKLDFRFANSIW